MCPYRHARRCAGAEVPANVARHGTATPPTGPVPPAPRGGCVSGPSRRKQDPRLLVVSEIHKAVQALEEVILVASVLVGTKVTRTVGVERLDEFTTGEGHTSFDALCSFRCHDRPNNFTSMATGWKKNPSIWQVHPREGTQPMTSRVWLGSLLIGVALLVSLVVTRPVRDHFLFLLSRHSEPAAAVPAATVAVTDSGKTFHVPGCLHLHGKEKLLEAQEAIREGFTPCLRCRKEAAARSFHRWQATGFAERTPTRTGYGRGSLQGEDPAHSARQALRTLLERESTAESSMGTDQL